MGKTPFWIHVIVDIFIGHLKLHTLTIETDKGLFSKEDVMIQHINFDYMANQNITFGLIGRGILGSNKSLRDLANHTVIIVSEEIMDESVIRETADVILARGCKNVAFCGEASEDLRSIFDEEDLEINGYEDFAVMWGIEDACSLADEISACWNEVLILCSSMSLVRECREALCEGTVVVD